MLLRRNSSISRRSVIFSDDSSLAPLPYFERLKDKLEEIADNHDQACDYIDRLCKRIAVPSPLQAPVRASSLRAVSAKVSCRSTTYRPPVRRQSAPAAPRIVFYQSAASADKSTVPATTDESGGDEEE